MSEQMTPAQRDALKLLAERNQVRALFDKFGLTRRVAVRGVRSDAKGGVDQNALHHGGHFYRREREA